jgi:hypothetical protein
MHPSPGLHRVRHDADLDQIELDQLAISAIALRLADTIAEAQTVDLAAPEQPRRARIANACDHPKSALVLGQMLDPPDHRARLVLPQQGYLYRQTILPMAAKILDALAAMLSDWLGPVSLSVDTDQISELAEDRTALWQAVGAAGFLTDAEKRDMLGFKET